VHRREGLRVSLGFFSDVLIPDYALQAPSLYNHEEGVWVWKYDGSDMFMDIGALQTGQQQQQF
jgi:DNA-directed RNA polymerase III subunit RPC8